jgi:chromate reductase
MLLAEAADAFGQAEVMEGDLNMPLYDGDLEDAEGIPAAAQALADQISAADAIVIAAPEYNKGISGVLKNALDWVSRVPGNPLAGKPVAVMSAAAGRTGGETQRFMTMSVLLQQQARVVPGPAVLVAGAMNEFGEDGRLTNERYREGVQAQMAALRDAI